MQFVQIREIHALIHGQEGEHQSREWLFENVMKRARKVRGTILETFKYCRDFGEDADKPVDLAQLKELAQRDLTEFEHWVHCRMIDETARLRAVCSIEQDWKTARLTLEAEDAEISKQIDDLREKRAEVRTGLAAATILLEYNDYMAMRQGDGAAD